MNPAALRHSQNVGHVMQLSGVTDFTVRKLKEYPGGDEFFRRRELAFKYDPAHLSRCPEGSLGREYLKHLKTQGLNPADLPPRPG